MLQIQDFNASFIFNTGIGKIYTPPSAHSSSENGRTSRRVCALLKGRRKGQFVGGVFRKKLIDMLLGNPMTVSQIARAVDEPPGRVADDLGHLFRSLKHTEYKAMVEPARCRACGFEFSEEKLTKPSKCPECHSTWVLEPKIGIQIRV